MEQKYFPEYSWKFRRKVFIHLTFCSICVCFPNNLETTRGLDMVGWWVAATEFADTQPHTLCTAFCKLQTLKEGASECKLKRLY